MGKPAQRLEDLIREIESLRRRVAEFERPTQKAVPGSGGHSCLQLCWPSQARWSVGIFRTNIPIDVTSDRSWGLLESELPEHLEQLAREHKTLETQYGDAKLRSAGDLLRLMLLHAGADLALSQAAALMAESAGPGVSHVTLHKKIRLAAPLLRSLVTRLADGGEVSPERWAGYEVVAVDASSFCGPGATTTEARVHLQLPRRPGPHRIGQGAEAAPGRRPGLRDCRALARGAGRAECCIRPKEISTTRELTLADSQLRCRHALVALRDSACVTMSSHGHFFERLVDLVERSTSMEEPWLGSSRSQVLLESLRAHLDNRGGGVMPFGRALLAELPERSIDPSPMAPTWISVMEPSVIVLDTWALLLPPPAVESGPGPLLSRIAPSACGGL